VDEDDSDPGATWVGDIARHRLGAPDATRGLVSRTCRGVTRVSRGYPAVYFELAERGIESTQSLAHTVFCYLDRREYGRHPFAGRTPLDAFRTEDMADRECRYHAFDARLSVTRETMRAQYAFNLRRHPEWKEREEVHQEVVAALRAECREFAGRNPRYPRYGLRSWESVRAPKPSWNHDEAVRTLRRRTGWSVSARVQIVLSLKGAPMYPGEISRVLQDADVAPGGGVVDPDLRGGQPDVDAILGVRRQVAHAWSTLNPDERVLLRCLIDGLSGKEIMARVPTLQSAVAVSRALKALTQRFVLALSPEGAARELRPKEVADLLLPVLLAMPGMDVSA
jgi:hypothetical protein